MLKTERNLTCYPIMWTTEGTLAVRDEQHAFRYEVRDERGDVIDFINTDRARSHPDVRWKRELFRDGKIEPTSGTFKTVEEALAAFGEEPARNSNG
jgi:hypothetical protein